MEAIEIGILIQQRRNELALSQEDVAEMTGVTTKTIYLLENGKGNPSLSTLQKIAAVLGLELRLGIKKIEP